MFSLSIPVLLLIVGVVVLVLGRFFAYLKQLRSAIEAEDQLKAHREDVFRRLSEISLQGSSNAIALATSLRCFAVFLFIDLLEMQGWESERWHPLVMQNLPKLPTDAQWWIDKVGILLNEPEEIVRWFIQDEPNPPS